MHDAYIIFMNNLEMRNTVTVSRWFINYDVHGWHLSLNQPGRASCESVCRAISISPDSGTPLLVPAHGAHHTLLLAHFHCRFRTLFLLSTFIRILLYTHYFILVIWHFNVHSASSLDLVCLSVLSSLNYYAPILLLLFLFQLILYNLSSPALQCVCVLMTGQTQCCMI